MSIRLLGMFFAIADCLLRRFFVFGAPTIAQVSHIYSQHKLLHYKGPEIITRSHHRSTYGEPPYVYSIMGFTIMLMKYEYHYEHNRLCKDHMSTSKTY